MDEPKGKRAGVNRAITSRFSRGSLVGSKRKNSGRSRRVSSFGATWPGELAFRLRQWFKLTPTATRTPSPENEDERADQNDRAAECPEVKRNQPVHLRKSRLPGDGAKAPPTETEQTQSDGEEDDEEYFHCRVERILARSVSGLTRLVARFQRGSALASEDFKLTARAFVKAAERGRMLTKRPLQFRRFRRRDELLVLWQKKLLRSLVS